MEFPRPAGAFVIVWVFPNSSSKMSWFDLVDTFSGWLPEWPPEPAMPPLGVASSSSSADVAGGRGISDRLILAPGDALDGVCIEDTAYRYEWWDVIYSTTQVKLYKRSWVHVIQFSEFCLPIQGLWVNEQMLASSCINQNMTHQCWGKINLLDYAAHRAIRAWQ